MQDRIETIIKQWMEREFKNEQALPDVVVKSLAEELNAHRYEIHSHVQQEYHMEDIEDAAAAGDVVLTQYEKDLILHRYEKLEDGNLDLLYDIIDEVVDARDSEEVE